LPDLLQVAAHRLARFFRVAALDGFEDSFVVKLAAIRTAFDIKNSQALFPQQADNGIEQRQYQRIRCCFRQREVKIQVRFNEGIGILPRSIHYRDCFSHRRKVLVFHASRCQRGYLGFQYQADFSQVRASVGLSDFYH